MNADESFDDYTLSIYNKLTDSGYYWNENDAFVGINYKRLLVKHQLHPDTELKLDFVNDIDIHYGGFQFHEFYGKIDSIQNILSNKISALFRYAEKDIVDLLYIAKNFEFHWEELIAQARSKDLGIENYLVSDILSSFPKIKLENIKWIEKQNFDQFLFEIQQMAKDCLEVKSNSLCKSN